MECNGVSLDPNFLINYQKSLTLKGKELTEKIHKLAEESFNIKSPKLDTWPEASHTFG